jgi:hypothetical protein
MTPYVFLAVLVALLAGLGVGKAWERYKLRDGRWSTAAGCARRRTTCSA